MAAVMLLSDEEARTLSCPFFRFIPNESDVLQHGTPPIYAHQSCHGSDCKIGWRWGPAGARGGVGYCGAFGAPLSTVEPEAL